MGDIITAAKRLKNWCQMPARNFKNWLFGRPTELKSNYETFNKSVLDLDGGKKC